VLLIQLPSIDDLREWYRYEEYSDIRKAVYIKLVQKGEELYSLIEPKSMATQCEEIEKSIWESRQLRRMDFIFNKRWCDITPFSILKQYERG